MKLILLGPPGAGKGTQAADVVDRYNIPHISTGDIFRKNLREETPLGKKAKEYMDKGELVPDEVTIAMVEDLLKDMDSYMLDGFPRTVAQAEALDKFLSARNEKLDVALCINADYSLLVKRIVGRRMCKDCSQTYHTEFHPPKKDGVCDKCGGQLYQRDDDKEETVQKRLDEYESKTKPLIEYYEKKNILKNVDGSRSVEEVSKDIFKILDEC